MSLEQLKGVRYLDNCIVGDIDKTSDQARVHFVSAFFGEGIQVPLVELEFLKRADVRMHDRFSAWVSLSPDTSETVNPTFLSFEGDLHGKDF